MTDSPYLRFWTFDDPRSFGARTIVAGLTRGLQAIGHEVAVTPLDPEASDASFHLRKGLEASRPDVLFFVNQPSSVYLGQMGYSPDEDESLTIPRLVWILDDPFFLGDAPFGSRDVVLAADPGFILALEARGARDVTYVPVAADRMKKGQPREKFSGNVAYVGSVMDMSGWRGRVPDGVAAYLDEIVELRLEDPRQTFEQLLDTHPLSPDQRIRFDGPLAYYLYGLANTRHRVRMLEPLVGLGLRLYGNEDWLRVLDPDSKLRDVYHPAIHPERDLPDLAASTSININLRSLQGFASPTQRDFIIPGFGGFLVSTARHAPDDAEQIVADRWWGLESPTASTPSELAELVETGLGDRAARDAWTEERREIIQTRHLYQHRARDVVSWLSSHVAGKAAPGETDSH